MIRDLIRFNEQEPRQLEQKGQRGMLSVDLIARLSARVAEPETRKDVPDIETLLAQTDAVAITGVFGMLVTGRGKPETDKAKPPPGTIPLASPASPHDVDRVEKRLGFELPEDLKHLYQAVANGGFGPGGGLATLDEAIGHYEELLADPPGELGQAWPSHLLPFNLHDIGCDCYDIKSGEIIYWDEESLVEGPSNRIWKSSFKKTADSLSAYLENWLAKAPPKNERFVSAVEAGFSEAVNEIDMHMVEHLRRSIDVLRTQTAEERSKWGLPEVGWEEALCEMQGLDPMVYLEMIKRTPQSD